MLSTFFFYGGLGVFALRLALAAMFFVHGWAKLKDLKRTGDWFGSVGFRPGMFWGTLAALLEFAGGGICLLFGFLVQPVAILLALQFVTIIVWKLARKQPFVNGWEFDLVVLGALLMLIANGGGAFSLDRIFFLGW